MDPVRPRGIVFVTKTCLTWPLAKLVNERLGRCAAVPVNGVNAMPGDQREQHLEVPRPCGEGAVRAVFNVENAPRINWSAKNCVQDAAGSSSTLAGGQKASPATRGSCNPLSAASRASARVGATMRQSLQARRGTLLHSQNSKDQEPARRSKSVQPESPHEQFAEQI